ncbi:glycoside hydrolase family 2 [Mediterraneibacter glycyrrhizinilyticus]|uniref:glycoside hydrolase family 2 n=1 Tax=Mediterraneibacter glycyrrhizinilyticus TaxID=342942 RepID=UPI0025A416DC|nr:glycoside hydrolase family 2 [Mediterraneibacter glycyrrhizinilyticus]MDM8210889.1 glycoside hydrolase family 2 [Mediterraneibacter glycyrrhizinilyticus]
MDLKARLKQGTDNYIFPFLWMRGEEESVMREEMEKIYQCGIRAVCVEARPHPDFCGEGWWKDLDVILDEAKKRNMKVWILDDKHFPTGYANGLIETKYPERKKQYINYTTADVFGDSHQLDLQVKRMLKPVMKFWDFGKQFDEEERAKNYLLSLVAVKIDHGNILREETIDLRGCFDGTWARFQLPAGSWRVYAVYVTRTDGGEPYYINMIDRVSAHTQIEGVYEEHYKKYGDLFGTVIAGFFSDEPQIGNVPGFEKNARLGKIEMPLPYSDELMDMMLEKYGDTFYQYLPYLWTDTATMNKCAEVRYYYMDCVSRLYQKNFCEPIGKWCEEHNVEYIGHVVEDDGTHSKLGMGAAHFFRALSGQHMAGIDCIGGQIVYGAPVEMRKSIVDVKGDFYHYLLGKMGASCGHLDPKKKGRVMCELFGAYGWRFGTRDMKYVLDHLICKGVNRLVPHAFSMAEYPDPDCPPHFYARGNNPQFPYFAELMKYANRMCEIFQGGIHTASAAVLYNAEEEWAGENMLLEDVGRLLLTDQIDFDVVSTDMLTDQEYFKTSVENSILHINGESFGVLIIPWAQKINKALYRFICDNPDLPVIFLNSLPESVVDDPCADIKVIENMESVQAKAEDELASYLRSEGFYDIEISQTFPELSFYHYEKDGARYMFQNEAVGKVFDGIITLKTEKDLVYYDGFYNEFKKLEVTRNNGKTSFRLELLPAHSCVVLEMEGEKDMDIYRTSAQEKENCTQLADLSSGWKCSLTDQKHYPEFKETIDMAELKPISDDRPDFAGVIRYEKEFELQGTYDKIYLSFEHVYEAVTLWINDEKSGICIVPPYEFEITGFTKPGINKIRADVATTLDRDQLNYPAKPFDFYHESMEPTGIFGKVLLAGRKSVI